MTPLPSLDFLRAFITAADERSAKTAARRLGISPSAVSQAVAKLELQAGTALFVKHARPLRLTPAGQRLADEARSLVEAADGLLARAAGTDLTSRTVRLGLGETVSTTFAPWLIAGLMERVGRLETETRFTQPLIERLRAGEVDVILTADPMLNEDRWLRVPLYDEDYLLCAGRAAGERTTDVRTLAATRPFIGYAGGSSDEVEIERILRTMEVRPARRILVSSSHTLVGLIAETGGWSLLPPTNLWCGRMFLENLMIEPVQAGVRRRRMWVVGDRRSTAEAVMLTAETAAKVFEEKMLPTLEEAQDGLSAHAMLVEHGKTK